MEPLRLPEPLALPAALPLMPVSVDLVEPNELPYGELVWPAEPDSGLPAALEEDGEDADPYDVALVDGAVDALGDVLVMLASEGAVPDRVAELQPANARPARRRVNKIEFFIGEFDYS